MFVLFVATVLISPFSGLLYAWVLQVAWNGFISPQYGEGPSLQAWFGISLIFQIMTIGIASKDDGDDANVGLMVLAIIKRWIMVFLLLGLASFARLVLGWG